MSSTSGVSAPFARRALQVVWRIGGNPYVVFAIAWWSFDLWDAELHERRRQLLTELPLLLLLYAALMQLLRPWRWCAWVAALPFAVLYLGSNYYSRLSHHPPDWYELSLVHQLGAVLRWHELLVLLVLFGVPLLLVLAFLDRHALSSWRALGLLVPVAIAGAVELAPDRVLHAAEANLDLVGWSDARNVRRYGRVFTSLLREARRRNVVERVGTYRPIESSALWVPPTVIERIDRRNVLVVMMESFFDPRQLTNVTYDRPPLHDRFLERLAPYMGSSISPAMCCGTARAEFEVLCGVPALGLVGGQEFNAFTGAPTYCLPRILGEAGYETTAFDVSGPEFYNSARAYRSLGFSRIVYGGRSAPARGADFISTRNKRTAFLFDGDLYGQVLDRFGASVRSGKPTFALVLTMFGHVPYDLDPISQPKVVTPTPPDAIVEVLANQIYYRTQALVDLVDAVRAIDPQVLVVMVADHMPTLPDGEKDLDRLGYRGHVLGDGSEHECEVPLIVSDGDRLLHLPLVRHFDLPALMLDRLTGGVYCRAKRCDFGRVEFDQSQYVDDYLTVLGLGARTLGQLAHGR